MIRRHASLLPPAALAALLLAAAPATALDPSSGKLVISAFGSAGYGRTNGNVYAGGDEVGSYDSTSFALAVMGHASDRLTVAGQICVERETEFELDWAFAEYKLHDALRLRLGKSKHPFGNYGEALDVGTLRPFFDAPTVIYGPAHIVASGYTGAGLSGFHRLGDAWSLGYDLYGGEIDLVGYHSYDQLFDADAVPGALEESEARDVVGFRISLETPAEGLTARLSGYTGRAEHEATGEEARHSATAASLEFLREALSARAEYAFLLEDELTAHAAYVELAWKFQSGLQLAGRVEGSWADLDELAGSSPLLRHREAALGVNYWFSDDLVVKASYHLVDGNRFAFDPTLAAAPTALRETTHLYVLGAQFSF